MLCQFSRPRGELRSRRVHPDGTGYEHGLYSVPDLPSDQVQYIETVFLKRLDDRASKALDAMLHDPSAVHQLPIKAKVAWASFLYTLLIRTPEILATMQTRVDEERARMAAEPGREVNLHPNVRLRSQELIPQLAASRLVVRGLIEMKWTARSVKSADYSMLTSDRPYIMTNGIAHAEGHIAIPLSPAVVFFATRSGQTFEEIDSMTPDQLVTGINSKVSEQAVRFVYGVDNRQARFVSNRFGKRIQSSPLG